MSKSTAGNLLGVPTGQREFKRKRGVVVVYENEKSFAKTRNVG